MLGCQKVLGKQLTWPVTWLGGRSQGERKVLESNCKKEDKLNQKEKRQENASDGSVGGRWRGSTTEKQQRREGR